MTWRPGGGDEERSDGPGEPDPRVSMLLRVTELLAVEGLRLDQLLDAVAATICDGLADTCGVALLSPDGSTLHPLGLRHRDARISEELDSQPGLAWSTVGGPSESTLSRNEALLVTSIDWSHATVGSQSALELLIRLDLGSFIVAPMRAGGIQIGVLSVARANTSSQLEESDIPYVQALADDLGLALAGARMREELQALDGTPPASTELAARLSDREREILGLIAQGLTNREIAGQIYLSVRTVEWHRSRLMAKLGASSRAELVTIAGRLPP